MSQKLSRLRKKLSIPRNDHRRHSSQSHERKQFKFFVFRECKKKTKKNFSLNFTKFHKITYIYSILFSHVKKLNLYSDQKKNVVNLEHQKPLGEKEKSQEVSKRTFFFIIFFFYKRKKRENFLLSYLDFIDISG